MHVIDFPLPFTGHICGCLGSFVAGPEIRGFTDFCGPIKILGDQSLFSQKPRVGEHSSAHNGAIRPSAVLINRSQQIDLQETLDGKSMIFVTKVCGMKLHTWTGMTVQSGSCHPNHFFLSLALVLSSHLSRGDQCVYAMTYLYHIRHILIRQIGLQSWIGMVLKSCL